MLRFQAKRSHRLKLVRYIITNFAYGTGPYLRTTELALAINRKLGERGGDGFGIIVPWVYGERQRRIMQEEFGAPDGESTNTIFLDRKLGELLRRVFYSGDQPYADSLRRWVAEYRVMSDEAARYLSGDLSLEDLSGKRLTVRKPDIALELARAPRIRFGVAQVYSVTFGYISEILEHALEAPAGAIRTDPKLMASAIAYARELEELARFHGLAEPGTFSHLETRTPRYKTECAIPPTITPPKPNDDPIEEGIYVTITGIPGLERLYAEARSLGLKLYSNDPAAVPGSEYLSPHVVPNPKIKLQFARSGWGSIWLSQLSGTPFVAPSFDPDDDPEIYFNNTCIGKLGLGIVYRGQPLREILDAAEKLKPGITRRNQEIERKFGTLDGNQYAAKRIVKETQ